MKLSGKKKTLQDKVVVWGVKNVVSHEKTIFFSVLKKKVFLFYISHTLLVYTVCMYIMFDGRLT